MHLRIAMQLVVEEQPCIGVIAGTWASVDAQIEKDLLIQNQQRQQQAKQLTFQHFENIYLE